MTVKPFKDRDPDARLKRMQHRFRAIGERHDRAAMKRRLAKRLFRPVLYGALFAGTILIALQFSPWPMGQTIKHIISVTNCDAARMLGLAPATRGQPGYWAKLDADEDGIACEPY